MKMMSKFREGKYMLYLLPVLIMGCTNNYFPKPYGYFRVDLPKQNYIRIDTIFPYAFDISDLAYVDIKQQKHDKNWMDIVYPKLNATIHCSYKPLNANLSELLEDAHRAVFKHSMKADDINTSIFNNPANRVYGVYYDLKGNVASVAQFVLTDSINHFFRGAVYFNHVPNKDSIAPMADYIKNDVIRFMESFNWK